MLIYFFYLILSPILWIIIHFAALFNYKIRKHLKDQKRSWKTAEKIIKETKRNRDIVVFHAASSGEFEQIKPILKKMNKNKFFILQTFFSPTIFNKEKNSELCDVICYHPFDFPWSVLSFLRKFKPKFYIITRHDIWPNFLHFARKFQTRCFLINANLHKKSTRLKFGFKQFNKWLFSNFETIFTGSERLKKNLSKLAENVSILSIGDSRFDQVIERKNNLKKEYFPKEISQTKNIIFGSILKSDFDVIFRALKINYPNGDKSLTEKKHRLMFVPHEIDEKTLIKIQSNLKELKIQSERYSESNGKIPKVAIIMDVVGILADLYKYADLCYVGGGFGAGIHSVIEPAVYGCVVSFGPNIHILDEAIEMYEQKIGTLIRNPNELSEFLKLIDENLKLKIIQLNSQKFVYDYQNVSEKIIENIFKNSSDL